MSTIASALPAGLQALSNAGMLPTNMTAQQVKNATPSELTQTVIDNVELTTISGIFGETAPKSDSVSLSSSMESALLGGSTTSSSTASSTTTDPLLAALNSELTTASTAATSASSAANASASGGTGSLFSYMG